MLYQDNSKQAETPWYPLFVYGTLRHGQENYTLLRGYTLSEVTARVEGLALYSLNTFPVAAPANCSVIGDLMTLNPVVYSELLKRLDAFEYKGRTHRVSLNRQLCQVHTAAGIFSAWIYRADAGNLPDSARIATGDWVQHQLQRIAATRLHRYIQPEIKKGR